MSKEGLAEARARMPRLPLNAVDGGQIVFVDPHDGTRATVIGAYWLLLDPTDPRIGHLHSAVDHHGEMAKAYAATATGVERYAANALVATRRLDVVHLIRQGDVIDYTEKGRDHDAKLAAVIASIQARTRRT